MSCYDDSNRIKGGGSMPIIKLINKQNLTMEDMYRDFLSGVAHD